MPLFDIPHDESLPLPAPERMGYIFFSCGQTFRHWFVCGNLPKRSGAEVTSFGTVHHFLGGIAALDWDTLPLHLFRHHQGDTGGHETELRWPGGTLDTAEASPALALLGSVLWTCNGAHAPLATAG